MPFEFQPTLTGELIELRPLRAEDHDALYAVACDPLIWEQHPAKERSEVEGFRRFFDEAMASGGAFLAIDRKTGKVDRVVALSTPMTKRQARSRSAGRSSRAPIGAAATTGR